MITAVIGGNGGELRTCRGRVAWKAMTAGRGPVSPDGIRMDLAVR
jgi:hypothetical protein